MEYVLNSRETSTLTKEYALVGLMKLSSRYAPCVERIKATITKYQASTVLELQSRSCEFLQIFRHEKIRCQVLERMPALDEQRHQVAVEGVEVVAQTTEEVLIVVCLSVSLPLPHTHLHTHVHTQSWSKKKR